MNVFSTKCPSCSAKIPFDPKTQLWVCDYCGGRYTAEQIKSFEQQSNQGKEETEKEAYEKQTQDFEIKEDNQDHSIEKEYGLDLDMYTCENCGAQIVADQNTSATFCVYCGGYSLLKDRLVGKFSPKYIIPFQATKGEAKKEYIDFIKSRKFVPNEFKSEQNIEKITGVYIPFWTYTGDIRVVKNGTGKRVKTWTTGNYQYTQTTEIEFNRDLIASFQDVPVDGSQKFDDDLMDSIEPFDYSKAQEFDPRFLSGFLAEKYDVDKDEAYKRAQLRMANTSNAIVDSSISLSSKNITQNDVSERVGKVDYWLLPVYMLNTKYKDQTYLFAMNGESKKVVGVFPEDKGKKALFFVSLLLLACLLTYIGQAVFATDSAAFIFGFIVIVIVFIVIVHSKFVADKGKKVNKA